MSRGLDRDRRESPTAGDAGDAGAQDRAGGASASNGRVVEPTADRARLEIRNRKQVYRLSPMEIATLRDVGSFRAIDERDLLRFRYSGNGAHLKDDYRNLAAQNLLQRKTISVGVKRHTLAVWSLTREGKRLVKSQSGRQDPQAIYAGFVKPRELGHDAAIYAMYQAEAAKITARGGRIRRVVLDFEFKRRVYSPLANARRLDARSFDRRQQEIAAENGLQVVDGKIPLPDLRIEYETPEGERAHVDLELATEHYHVGHMAAKTAAGFKLYGTVSTSRGARAEWEGRELTSVILGF